jgi:GT2 family glycosyltransferase/glycosyltransferase involved in cell wall biosynthesis
MALTVDVIIPVYGAPAALRACLESVVSHTDLARHRLVLVVDGPQDAEVESVIANFSVLRNETRLGFTGSVNRGMAASTNDVVLLNSDTVVTPRWLEKLMAAAYSSSNIGTVTPLSNNATICSVPRGFEENLLPNGFDITSFAALVERVSMRSYPRIPTGVGVCLYIRRAVLDDIGLFDAANFPLGYGEENDFCLRASKRGWVHIADDATFIYHAGHASFGASRTQLQRKARATMRRLHPRYMATIAEAMRHDPIADVRARIQTLLPAERGEGAQRADEGRRIVHLVHGWPPFQQAGTELYAWWLVREQQKTNHVAVYTRGADPARADGEVVEWLDEGVRVRIVTNHFTSRNPLRRNAIRNRFLERDFERFLKEERPDLVHIHHLAGHAFSLARVAKQLKIPIVMQLQDWWALCARVNLFHRDGIRCSGPAPAKCAACATLTRVPLMNRPMHAMRRAAARAAIAAADVCVVGSNAIRGDYVRAGVTTPIHVLPYGVDIVPPDSPRPPARRPIRFGFVGSDLPHKGLQTAVEAMRGFTPEEATLERWGGGNFREEDKPRVFASMDVLLVPSIGLESFGLAAREAMACGVPVIASAGGALSEMTAEFFPPGDVDALRAILRRVVDDPSLVDQWAARITPPKRSDVHAAEIERVYDSVLR